MVWLGKLGKVFYGVFLCISDLPDDHPRITGVNEQYEPGEGITATCTAWHSNPPANLSWFINGEPVSTQKYARPKGVSSVMSTLDLLQALHDCYAHKLRVNNPQTLLMMVFMQIKANFSSSEYFMTSLSLTFTLQRKLLLKVGFSCKNRLGNFEQKSKS